MKLDVPTGTTFYYNPYSPKYYTIVQSPTGSLGSSPHASFAAVDGAHPMNLSSRCSSNGSPSDDEGSFAAHSSINSLLASTEKVCRRPSDDVYNLGWATISSVRQEKTTDAAICTMIQRFPFKTLTAMAAVIENSPNLFLELCEKERGNVVAHVISALQGEMCEELIALTADHIYRLATHQSGCIALSRIFDGANADQQMTLSVALLQHFDALLCHQFGNFVLSRVAQSGDSSINEYLSAQFESGEVLRVALADKFGSHVFEAFAKNAQGEHLFRVCSVLLADMDFLLEVATSRIANYPLQAALRQMMTIDPSHDLSRWALNTIPQLVVDTKFATNINRALGFGRTVVDREQERPRGMKKGIKA